MRRKAMPSPLGPTISQSRIRVIPEIPVIR